LLLVNTTHGAQPIVSRSDGESELGEGGHAQYRELTSGVGFVAAAAQVLHVRMSALITCADRTVSAMPAALTWRDTAQLVVHFVLADCGHAEAMRSAGGAVFDRRRDGIVLRRFRRWFVLVK
jgi:hypothetical protein